MIGFYILLYKTRGEYIRRLYINTLTNTARLIIPIVLRGVGSLYPSPFRDIYRFKGS